jgi:mono/diheme cytochrome c family protein
VLAQPTWTNIEAIFATNCGPCHIGAATAGLNLETYQALMKGGSTSAGGVVNGAVIKARNPAGSYLYQAVSGTQKVGARMPLGRPALSKTDIQNIYNWIHNGAKGP